MEGVSGQFLRSAGAAYFSQIFRITVTLVTALILRRLIPPDQWGVWTWIEPLFFILAQVRDLGIPGHMVRDRDRPWGNFLAVEAVFGTLFALLVLLAAPLLALGYEDQAVDVVPALRLMALFLVAHGLGMVPMIFFESELAVQKTVPAEIARNLVFAGLSITLAWYGFSYWSMLIAHIAGTATYSAVLWWSARGLLRIRWTPRVTGRLIRVSLPLMVMAFLEQTTLHLDKFILGQRFETKELGFADLALFAVFFFSRRLADPIGRALYPALVRFRDDPERAFDGFRWATLTLLVVLTPAAFFFFVEAEAVAIILGGEKWVGSADYLRVLSLVPLVRMLGLFGIEYLLTQHRDRLLILGTLANLVSVGGVGFFLVRTELGPLGMAWANYLPLGMVLYAWQIHRIAPRGMMRFLREVGELYLVNAMLFLPLMLFDLGLWVLFALGMVSGLLSVGWSFRRYGDAVREFLAGAGKASDAR